MPATSVMCPETRDECLVMLIEGRSTPANPGPAT